jgi:CheY-like chemotaxis protein
MESVGHNREMAPQKSRGASRDTFFARDLNHPPEALLMQQVRQRILCVEGNPDIREMLTILLGAVGYEATSVATVQDATRFIAHDHFDLFILDKLPPRTDAGLELCRELRRQHPHIPIIIYSADALERHHREAAEAGATAYIDKPHIKPLVRAVEKLIQVKFRQRSSSEAHF